MIALYLDVFLLLAGPFIGSFITAAANAWPNLGEVGLTRSNCASCRRVLGPLEMIPILSFLIQKGRCKACAAPIWPGHPIGEALALLVAAGAVWAGADPVQTGLAALLGWTLLFAALVDARTYLLPDISTLPLIPLGVLAAWLRAGPAAALDASIGAAIGFFAFWALAEAYKRLRGRDGLGLGDAKLLAAAGAWAGPLALPWIVFIAALSTLAFVYAGRLRGQDVRADTAAPFGPGLALAAWLGHLAALAGIGALSDVLYF